MAHFSSPVKLNNKQSIGTSVAAMDRILSPTSVVDDGGSSTSAWVEQMLQHPMFLDSDILGDGDDVVQSKPPSANDVEDVGTNHRNNTMATTTPKRLHSHTSPRQNNGSIKKRIDDVKGIVERLEILEEKLGLRVDGQGTLKECADTLVNSLSS